MAEVDAGLSATDKALRQELGEYASEEKLVCSRYGLSYFELLRTEWSLIPNTEEAIGAAGYQRLQEILKKPVGADLERPLCLRAPADARGSSRKAQTHCQRHSWRIQGSGWSGGLPGVSKRKTAPRRRE